MNAIRGCIAIFTVESDSLFKLEQLFWRLAATAWPGSAKRRLWLAQPVTKAATNKHLSRVKTIVRSGAVRGVHNTHVFILRNGDPESWTEHRQKIGHADHRLATCSTDILGINHYYSKCLAEYRERRSVPSIGHRADFRGDDQLLRFIESDTVEDITIQRFVPALQGRLNVGPEAEKVVQMTGPRNLGHQQ